MKKVSGSLKLEYSQYRELQAFSQFGSDLDADTKARLAKGERIVEVLKQPQSSPLTVQDQVVIIYAVINDYLTDVPVDKTARYQKELLAEINEKHGEITDGIKNEKVLSPENEEKLKAVLKQFTESFVRSL